MYFTKSMTFLTSTTILRHVGSEDRKGIYYLRQFFVMWCKIYLGWAGTQHPENLFGAYLELPYKYDCTILIMPRAILPSFHNWGLTRFTPIVSILIDAFIYGSGFLEERPAVNKYFTELEAKEVCTMINLSLSMIHVKDDNYNNSVCSIKWQFCEGDDTRGHLVECAIHPLWLEGTLSWTTLKYTCYG